MKNFQFIFFLLFSIDLAHQCHERLRWYDEFDIAHFWFLPTIPRFVFFILCMIIIGLCICICLQLWTKNAIFYISILFSILYFTSAQDQFQHHYLLCIILFYLSDEDDKRCLFTCRLQLSIVYFFTAITKILDEGFMDGTLLEFMLKGEKMTFSYYLIEEFLGHIIKNHDVRWRLVSLSVIGIELLLCIGFLILNYVDKKFIRILLCSIGMPLHLFMHLSRLGLQFFSIYMLLLYGVSIFPGLDQ